MVLDGESVGQLLRLVVLSERSGKVSRRETKRLVSAK
jgi:hypothetical protein